jgi:ABC-type antimicrobial peptide transport system permease subunit
VFVKSEMKKVLIFICCVFLSALIGVFFGVLHNQFTFTVSNEFFTEVLFERFGFIEYGRNAPRVTASIIGAWSTWWIGLTSGFIFAFIGLFYSNSKESSKDLLILF